MRGKDREDLVLLQQQLVIQGHRRVADPDHLDLDRGRNLEAGFIGQRVGQAEGPEVVRIGRDAVEATVEFLDHGRAAERRLEPEEDHLGAQRDIIVRHQFERIEVDEGILEHLVARVRHSHRNFKERQYQNLSIADTGRAEFVGHAVVETTVPEVTIAALEHGCLAILEHRAVVAVEDLHDREGVALHIAVVEQQIREIDGEGFVLIADEQPIGIRDGRVVHGFDVEGDRAGVAQAAIGDGVAEACLTVDVFVGHELVPAIRQLDDATIPI